MGAPRAQFVSTRNNRWHRLLMSRMTSHEGNFIFPSFSESLSAAQPLHPVCILLGPNILDWIVFPPLFKQSSLMCHPVPLSAVFQMTQ